MTPARRSVLLAVAGLMLVQVAWLLALPAFSGIDEIPHAYRAYGVAHGQWRLTEESPNGTGELVDVPSGLVAAAHDQCSLLARADASICAPVADRGHGLVAVGTAAGSYTPAFYWFTGTAARAWDGTAALYAMRVAAALTCLLLLGIAFGCLAATRRSGLAWLALLAGLTPTLLYSSVLVAPNGLEMAAGIAAWAGLLSVFARPGLVLSRRAETGIVVAAAVACSVLAGLRLLGPVWLLAIALSVLVQAGPRRVVGVLRARPAAYAVAAACVALAGVANLAWSRSTGLASVGAAAASAPDAPTQHWTQAVQLPLWTLQALAAAPYRNNPGPAVVYPLLAVVVVGVFWSGLRTAGRRARVTAALGVGLAAAIPIALVAVTLSSQTDVWQGRYALPYLAGLPLLAAWARPDPSDDAEPSRGVLVAALVCLGVAQVLEVVHVRSIRLSDQLDRLHETWPNGPLALPLGAAVLGWLLVSAACLLATRGPEPAPDPERTRAGVLVSE